DILPTASKGRNALYFLGRSDLRIEHHLGGSVDGNGVGARDHTLAIDIDDPIYGCGAAVRIKPQGIHHPVGNAVGVVDGVGASHGVGDKVGAKITDLPRIRDAVVVGITGQVTDGGLEQTDRERRVVNTEAVVHGDKLVVVNSLQELRRHVGICFRDRKS